MDEETPRTGCDRCAKDVDFPFTMAFQPIVDLSDNSIFAHEALVRGPYGEGAGHVLSQVEKANMHAFDQQARVTAIELASRLDMTDRLSINFLPNAVYKPENCLRTSIDACLETGFPVENIIFEITETEQVENVDHLKEIIREYRRQGFQTAIDDFGSGFAGLNLLAEFQPDIVKLDMELTRSIDQGHPRQAIAKGMLEVCRQLDISVIAEGIETVGELRTLRDMGVSLFQGYLFAKPQFERVLDASEIAFPD